MTSLMEVLLLSLEGHHAALRLPVAVERELGSLSNHDDDGNKSPTNLHI